MRGSSSTGGFCPCGAGIYHPSGVNVFTTWKVSELRIIGVLMEAPSRGHDQLLTPFPASFPSLEKCVCDGGEPENSKLLIMA